MLVKGESCNSSAAPGCFDRGFHHHRIGLSQRVTPSRTSARPLQTNPTLPIGSRILSSFIMIWEGRLVVTVHLIACLRTAHIPLARLPGQEAELGAAIFDPAGEALMPSSCDLPRVDQPATASWALDAH